MVAILLSFKAAFAADVSGTEEVLVVADSALVATAVTDEEVVEYATAEQLEKLQRRVAALETGRKNLKKELGELRKELVTKKELGELRNEFATKVELGELREEFVEKIKRLNAEMVAVWIVLGFIFIALVVRPVRDWRQRRSTTKEGEK